MECFLTDQIKSDMVRLDMAPEDGRILAAVSGGADSVCLLLALKEIGYEVSAVHVEHGIRGEESLADCSYVRRLCREHSVPLKVFHVDAPAVARQEDMSLEEAARQERYRAIRRAAEEMGIECVATAHHRMDQAETILWNLIRGSSIQGLGGIRPKREEDGLTLIRPLIGCGRDAIEAYLKHKGTDWCSDRTNEDTAITRNAIRLKVLPLLESLNPQAVKHITEAAQDLREADIYLEEKAEEAFREVVLSDPSGWDLPPERDMHLSRDLPPERDLHLNRDLPPERDMHLNRDLLVDRDLLASYPRALRLRVIHRMIGVCSGGLKDITRRHVESLDSLCCGDCGRRVSLPRGIEAVSEARILRLRKQSRSQNQFHFSDRANAELALTGDGLYSVKQEDTELLLDVKYITWEGGEVPKKKYTKYLAYDTITPCLTVRTRRPGDYIVVNDSFGRRKLKDYLIDEKVPRDQRDSILLVTQGSYVLWVIGMRISESAKVRKGSKAVRIEATFHF